MLSAKMKAKKLIWIVMACTIAILDAGTVHHTMISVTEQKIMGHMFKHVITSGGAEKDEFFIDGYAVSKENYLKDVDRSLKREREEEMALQEQRCRSRVQFTDMVQVEIAAKLLHKVLTDVADWTTRVQSSALSKYFVFSDSTIDSFDQLLQLKTFAEQLKPSIQKKIENNDFEGLNILYSKLEYWPSRLEKFFQDTVQNAIKKSDDTAMLKELLKLVSEPSTVH